MASLEPNASVLDPKPAETVLDKEPKVEVNGHTPAPEPSTDKPTEPPVESKAESQTETKDEPDESPEKPLVNGNGLVDSHAGTNGVTSSDVETKETKPAEPEKTQSENSPVVPAEEPKPAEPEPVAEDKKEADTPATEALAPESSVADPPAAEAEEAPKHPAEELGKSEDVEMTGAPTESAASAPVSKPASPAPASSATPAKPAAGSSAVEDSNQDTEMADKPEEPSSAEKPKDVDDSVPPSEDAVPTSEVDLHPASMSQLALDQSEVGPNPDESSIEVSMLDAPGSKIAREREDDAAEEPAPKRAKTEPNEDEPAMDNSTIEAAPAGSLAAQGSAQLEPGTLSTLPQWDDAEKASKTITAFQRREMRKVMGRIKKTKHGGSFRDSVQKLWPAIWESYVAKIEKPMDLSEVDRGLRDSTYTTIGDFKNDLALIYLNTLAFNGPTHDITGYALGAIRTTWEDVRRIPEEEPVKVKAVSKPKPVRESRAIATANINASSDTAAARQPAGPVATPAGDAPETKSQPASAPQQAADARRASTVTEGDRPKRTVRAPKPKDIDYSTKSSRKKLKPELQFCEEVLAELFHPRNATVTQWFKEPVDAEGLGIPQYYSTIKKPMDLGTVSKLLGRGDITSLKDFDKNVKLIFSNCYQFNGPPSQGNAVSALAHQLEELYLSQMKGKDAWMAKHAKANARQASTSNASDDEDEDGDDEGDGEDALGPDPSIEIKKLEARYQEENSKLNAIILSDNPTQMMIDLQQVVLKAIQEALLKAKLSQTEYRQKQEKGGKKGGKAAKTKASGGGGRKSLGNASQPKKAGGSKKTAKKTLTPADKDQIANAINDLEGNHLDRAIEIIKRDTGQNENNDGELELDIDQLSNEALLKLWELCKKVLPGFAKDTSVTTKSPEVSRATPKQQQNNAAKPKKNKPMSAQEQEARIAQLQNLSAMYRPGQGPADGMEMVMETSPTAADSSEESSSEEE